MAAETHPDLRYVHVSFGKYDSYDRFLELLLLPELLDKPELDSKESDILIDFEIRLKNTTEDIKKKIQFLIDEWIQANPDGYLLYQWDIGAGLRNSLDNREVSLLLRTLLSLEPETVKLFQSSKGYDTERVDGDINHFMVDYYKKQESITNPSLFEQFKMSIYNRNKTRFQELFDTQFGNLTVDERTKLLLYSFELKRNFNFGKMLLSSTLINYGYDSKLKQIDLSRFIIDRCYRILSILVTISEMNTIDLIKYCELSIQYFPEIIRWFLSRLRNKTSKPNIEEIIKMTIDYDDDIIFGYLIDFKFINPKENPEILELLSFKNERILKLITKIIT